MKTPYTKLLAGAAALGLFVAAPAMADGNGGNDPQGAKDTSTTTNTFPCDNADDRVEFTGDLKLWPPNHKYSPYDVVAIDGDAEEDADVTLTTRVTHDEYVEDFMPEDENSSPGDEEVGAGNTANDASPFYAMDSGSDEASTHHDLRSERSGRGDGRTYTFYIDARFDGEECQDGGIEQTVEVPHDMRSDKAPAKEDKTDSTGPDQG